MHSRYFVFPAICVIIATSCSRTSQNPREAVVGQTYLHKYGVALPPEEWQARGKTGAVVSTRKDGVVVTENYADGELDGEKTYTFPHAVAIDRTEHYKNGKLVREVKHYYSGSPEEEIAYAPNGRKVIRAWYESGSPRMIERYVGNLMTEGDYLTIDNQLESRVVDGGGERVRRDKYGNLLSRDDIRDGTLVLRHTFHPNGSPLELIPFRDNIVEGQLRVFFPDGEPERIETWENGVQSGVTIVFQNGEKFAEVPYVQGTKHGVERRFAPDGQTVVEELTWAEGHKHGPYITYINKEARVDWYHHGQQVNKTAYDRLNRKSGYATNS